MYDPATARFLSKDPIEYAGGDANLYRYTANDPINHVDPSGNAILIPPCELEDQPRPYTNIGDILRDKIFANYGTWKVRDSIRIKESNNEITVNNHAFRALNLFEALPAETWGKIQAGTDELSAHLTDSISNYIVATRNPDFSLRWSAVPPAPMSTFDKAATLLGKVAGYTPLGLAIGGPDVTTRLAQSVAEATKTITASVRDAIVAAGGEVAAFGNRVIDSVENIVLIGLASILKEASRTAGFDPDKFLSLLETIKQGATQLASIATAFVTRGIELGTTFAFGLKDGLTSFVENIEQHFKNGLVEWLGLPKPLANFDLANAGWSEYAGLILGLIGYTWDDLIGIILEAIPVDFAVILEIFENISAFFGEEAGPEINSDAEGMPSARQPSLYKWISDLVGKAGVLDSEEGLQEFGGAILVAAGQAIAEAATIAIAKWLIKILLAALPTGFTQVATVALVIYDVISWIIENKDKIAALFESIQSLFADAIGGQGREKIADQAEKLLAKSVAPILSGVAHLAGAGSVPTRIRRALQHVRDAAQKPVKSVVKAAAKPAEKAIMKAGQLLDGNKTKSLVPPISFGTGKKKKLWIDQSGKPWVRINPDIPATEFVNARSKSNPKVAGQANDALRKVDTQYKKLETTTKATKGPKSSKGSPPVGSKTKQVKDALADKKALSQALTEAAKLLEQLGGGCAVTGTGRCFVAGTAVWATDRISARIERVRLGDRVRTAPHGVSGRAFSQTASDTTAGPLTHRAVWFVQARADGVRVTVGLLRSLEWLAEYGFGAVGDRVELDLPEMGAEGEFRVSAIDDCPEIGPGPGRIVTGVFHFSRGDVYDLWVAGERGPIGVTAGHPFWSVDRQGWIPAEELLEGERLATRGGGTTTVRRWEYRGEEPVYNLEVDADHCYRVGEQGILVHNASCPNEILAVNARCALFDESFVGKEYIGFDSMGRAQGVRARICNGNTDGGSAPIEKEEFYPKGYKEAGMLLLNRGVVVVRAHLLAEAFGGPGTPKNLVTTCKSVNNKMKDDFETYIKAWLKDESTVDVEVTVDYIGDSPYPSKIHVKARRLNCQKSSEGHVVCDEIYISGGITAPFIISDCPGAKLR